MNLRRVAITALAAALLAAGGCGPNTKITRQWSSEGLKQGSFEKTMVLVLGPPYNRRQTAEDHIVTALRGHGVKAVRSWDVLPQEQLGDRETIARAVEATGADSVVALRLVSVARDERAYEGREQWTPVGTTMDYYGYVATSVAITRKPDVAVVRKGLIETTLWDVPSRKLVWSAESESTTASQTITTGEFTDDYAKVLAKELARFFRR